MTTAGAAALATVDPKLAALVGAEAERRRATIDLIASESEPSAPILEALGSVFASKTAEGYPGRRYHRGTVHADAVEQLAIGRARALFGADHANVQPSSGVNANPAVYRALLEPGDAVLALQLSHGGHLSHGDPASITVRLGTSSCAQRGMGEPQMREIAAMIDDVLGDTGRAAAVAARSEALAGRFPMP